jgi:hypothetical protein
LRQQSPLFNLFHQSALKSCLQNIYRNKYVFKLKGF